MMTDDPNAMQIGGSHYQSEYQVWDFTEKHGLGGLEMCIIKYICRWREKGNGTTDLEKAVHYVSKLIDLYKNKGRVPKGVASQYDTEYFCNMQELTQTEAAAVTLISRWSCQSDLVGCRSMIQGLIHTGDVTSSADEGSERWLDSVDNAPKDDLMDPTDRARAALHQPMPPTYGEVERRVAKAILEAELSIRKELNPDG